MSIKLNITAFESPIGWIKISAGDEGVNGVYLLGTNTAQKPEFHNLSPHPIAQQAAEQILEYIEKRRTQFDVLLNWNRLSPFQRRVLQQAQQIPYGEVLTYGQLAALIGNPAASRAVGGAMARNPMPILIPCHRVVASNGALRGFSAADGILTKKWLLELEGHKNVSQKLD